jgi:branched-chain amino acid transport system substrate-binding protein
LTGQRVKISVLLGSFFFLLFPACGRGSGAGSAAKVPQSVLIAATLPLTGSEARVGGFFKEGYEFAFEVANKAGGLQLADRKVPVRLRLLDDTSTPATSVNLTNKLVSDGSHALLGTYSTTLVQAQSTAADRASIPYVNGGGAATAIYARDFKWVFGVLAPVELLADNLMGWLQKQQDLGKLPRPAKVGIVWENTSHGTDYRTGVRRFVEQHAATVSVALDEPFELGTKDFSGILSKVKAARLDALMADAHLEDFITMHRQYLGSGLCHLVITYGARGSEKAAVDALGQNNVAYILSAVWWHAQLAQKSAMSQQFVTAFKGKFGRDPEWYQAVAYETARALFRGIEQAGSVDKEAVRNAMAKLNMESLMPGGRLSFPKETGQQARYPFVVQQNLPDGSSPIIYPDDLATGTGVAPNPSCKNQ